MQYLFYIITNTQYMENCKLSTKLPESSVSTDSAERFLKQLNNKNGLKLEVFTLTYQHCLV